MAPSSQEKFVCLQDFEDYALRTLPQNALGYYNSGANQEQTLSENKTAFRRLRLRPRCLVDVSSRNLGTYVLGKYISFPVCIAPSAMQRMAHPDGEVATAKAASAEGTMMTLSTLSTSSIEDVAKASATGLRWFQLYIYKDRNVTRNLVQRAEKNGFQALVLTVDTPIIGTRFVDERNKFVLPPPLRLANFEHSDVKSTGYITEAGSGLFYYAKTLFNASITWADISWLKSITSLPIIAKGILTREDAILAVNHGVSAIVVSNHGGRQLDGVPATIEALPEVVEAVDNRCEVYLDGGVRTGTDVFKALALGAKVVFIGRPVLWGLAHSGQDGVQKVLKLLKDEFDIALALAGCRSVDDIKRSMVVHQEYYSKL